MGGALIDEKLKRMPRTVRVGDAAGGLSEKLVIQQAIDWCSTQAVPAPSATNPYTVEIWPGIYDESLTMADYVHLKGLGPEGAVVISQDDANVVTLADSDIENVTLRVVNPTGGRAHVRDGASTVVSRLNRVRFEVTNPGAVVSNVFVIEGNGSEIWIENCSHNIGGTGGSYTITSQNNPATFHLFNNDFVFQNANSTHILCLVASTMSGGNNRWGGTGRTFSVTSGTIIFNGDSVTTAATENIVGGTVCLKNNRQQYEVLEGMWIQDAIDMAGADTPVPSATNPYTVLIHPGLYNENITMDTYVHLKGIGPEGSVVIYQSDDDDIITLAAGYQEIQDITIRLVNPSQARTMITDGGAAASSSIERCRIEIATPGAFGHTVFELTGGGTHSLKHNFANIASGAGTFQFIDVNTAAATLLLVKNDITCDQGDMIAVSIAAATISGGYNRWAGSQATLFNVSASGLIELDRDAHETEAADTCNLANSNVVLREGPDHFQVWPGMQIQHAVDNLSVGGGKVELIGSGSYALTAQVTRAIDNIQIYGNGVASRVELDDVTAVISAGTQDGWILRDFDTDLGGVDIASATNSTLHNVTKDGLHVTMINPDEGVNRFPGQPIIRLEEIRPLNPALNPIIKNYSQQEYQLYNPTFATPEFIMDLLTRQARTQVIPLNSLWTDNSGGTGSSTIEPQQMTLACAAAGGDHGLAYCTAAFVNSSFGAGNYLRVDFDNKIIIAFDIRRDSGTHADLNSRFQLKQANGEGQLAADGLGIEVQDYDIWGECFNAARSTVDLGVTMTAEYAYRIMIVHTPGVSVDFYVNDQYKGSITTVANIPSGVAAGQCYWVGSIDNGAQNVACEFSISPILFWNHL